jgi:hypothetical protein
MRTRHDRLHPHCAGLLPELLGKSGSEAVNKQFLRGLKTMPVYKLGAARPHEIHLYFPTEQEKRFLFCRKTLLAISDCDPRCKVQADA